MKATEAERARSKRYRDKMAKCPIAVAKKKLLNQQRYLKDKAKKVEIVKPEFDTVEAYDEWWGANNKIPTL